MTIFQKFCICSFWLMISLGEKSFSSVSIVLRALMPLQSGNIVDQDHFCQSLCGLWDLVIIEGVIIILSVCICDMEFGNSTRCGNTVVPNLFHEYVFYSWALAVLQAVDVWCPSIQSFLSVSLECGIWHHYSM